jgi:hypothetical protein
VFNQSYTKELDKYNKYLAKRKNTAYWNWADY